MNLFYYTEHNLGAEGKAALNPMPSFSSAENALTVLDGVYTGGKTGSEVPARIVITETDMTTGLLLLGSAGSGKTNVIRKIFSDVCQGLTEDDLLVVYDVKGDYIKDFYLPGDYLLDPLSYTNVWNLYSDVLAFSVDQTGTVRGEEIRLRAMNAASLLFEGQRAALNPFFYNAAVQTVAGVISLNIRRSLITGDRRNLNNRALLNELRGTDAEGYRTLFLDAGNEYRALASYFDSNINDGRAIVTEIASMAERRLVGAFAGNGSLSIVDLVKNRGGKVLFIANDMSMGDALSPAISLIVDLLISAAASRQFTGRGRIFLFLDELPTLRVNNLPMALTLLRQNKLCIVAGLQNVERLRMNDPANQNAADALLSSFRNLIMMRNDGITARYVADRIGKTRVMRVYDNIDGSSGQQIADEDVIETQELSGLRIGEAFCRVGGAPVFRFRFNEYKLIP